MHPPPTPLRQLAHVASPDPGQVDQYCVMFPQSWFGSVVYWHPELALTVPRSECGSSTVRNDSTCSSSSASDSFFMLPPGGMARRRLSGPRAMCPGTGGRRLLIVRVPIYLIR